MSKIPSISDALRVVVGAVNDDLKQDPDVKFSNIPTRVYFQHGTWDDLLNVLLALTKAGDGKYPLVWLVRTSGIAQTLKETSDSYSTKATVRILICTITNPSLRANERETVSFKNILHPILEKLIAQISISPVFGMPSVEDLNITFSDNYSLGKMKLDGLGDNIDAVDISRMSICVQDLACIESNFITS